MKFSDACEFQEWFTEVFNDMNNIAGNEDIYPSFGDPQELLILESNSE